MEPVDALGFIGVNPGSDENLLIATGDSGNGMTHGTIAGLLIPDLIGGGANPWAGLYDPARKTPQSVGTFARENLKVAGHHADLVTPSEMDQISDIQPGCTTSSSCTTCKDPVLGMTGKMGRIARARNNALAP
jgi:hypothetical protein